MAVGEAAREGLRRRLDEVLGEEHATTLMGHLSGFEHLARREDVSALDRRGELLEQRVDHLRDSMDQRFTQLEDRMDRRDEVVDQRFTQLERSLERLIDDNVKAAQQTVIATLRGDIVTQTRTMFLTMAGSVAALGGLALGLSRL